MEKLQSEHPKDIFTIGSLTSIRTKLSPPPSSSKKKISDLDNGFLSEPTIVLRSHNRDAASSSTGVAPSAEPLVTKDGVTSLSINANPLRLDEILNILKSQPSEHELSKCIKLINTLQTREKSTPLLSRIIHVLVTEIIPNFWPILTSPGHKEDRDALVQCLSNITGLSGIIAGLRRLNTQVVKVPGNVVRKTQQSEQSSGWNAVETKDLLDVLARILKGENTIYKVWQQLYDGVVVQDDKIKADISWKEFVSLIAGGKLLSVTAEAASLLNERVEDIQNLWFDWISDGKEYATWLGVNISMMMKGLPLPMETELDKAGWKSLGLLLGRGLGLGYIDALIDKALYEDISGSSEEYFRRVRILLSQLSSQEAKIYVNATLRALSKKYLSTSTSEAHIYEYNISMVAAIIDQLCADYENDRKIRDIIIDWIGGNGDVGAGEDTGIRRAIFASINQMSDGIILLQDLLEKLVADFGDPLSIRHVPTLHQEVGAQCLLLAVSYIHRQPPSYVKIVARSSPYLNAISNRIGSTNLRVRFLGMVVGQAVSSLIDSKTNQMKFSGIEEMETEEAESWMKLVIVNDQCAKLDTLQSLKSQEKNVKNRSIIKVSAKPSAKILSKTVTTIEELDDDYIEDFNNLHKRPQIIEEVDDEDDEDDLVPYGKPDSDPEDEEDDPTLINRDKKSAPVYIRDLLYMLNSQDSFDDQKLALESAAMLIRRKAAFGTEVTSHLKELLETLVGMQDKYDMEEFDTMRLKGLISLVVTLPKSSGQWMSKCIFDGEWSLSQRCIILSAIGFGALELSNQVLQQTSTLMRFELTENEKKTSSFPSKRLSKRLHDVYRYRSTPIDALSIRLQSELIQPMAVKAADQLSGPDVLKVRKFSSRMDVEAKRKAPTSNKLGQIVGEAFFTPLLNQWWAQSGSSTNYLHPHLLSLYIKTLTIIFHATGPNTVIMPQLTTAFWDLLLSLKRHSFATSASTVLDAILLGLLTILEVNNSDESKRRLAEQSSRELIETQEWATGIFEGSSNAEGDDEKRRGLAAGILLRLREVVEKYERLLMGVMLD